MVAQARRSPHQPNTTQKQHEEKHPHDAIRAILSLLAEYGLTMWVEAETGTLSMDSPQGWQEHEVRALRVRLEQQRVALRCYYTVYPQSEWPRCFFDEDGAVLMCVRGHEYDLCRGDDEGRTWRCKCYYDWSWQEKKRIGKEE